MFDIFGHFVAQKNQTFEPKEKVIITALGPWRDTKGWIVEYVGNDTYRVNVSSKGGFGQTLSFHRNELTKEPKGN